MLIGAIPLGGLQLVEAISCGRPRKSPRSPTGIAKGRIVSMLEGGYDLEALAKSVGVHVRTLMDVGA